MYVRTPGYEIDLRSARPRLEAVLRRGNDRINAKRQAQDCATVCRECRDCRASVASELSDRFAFLSGEAVRRFGRTHGRHIVARPIFGIAGGLRG